MSRSGARHRDHQTGSLRRFAWLWPKKPKDTCGADPQRDPRDPPPLNSAFSKSRSCASLLKNAANST